MRGAQGGRQLQPRPEPSRGAAYANARHYARAGAYARAGTRSRRNRSRRNRQSPLGFYFCTTWAGKYVVNRTGEILMQMHELILHFSAPDPNSGCHLWSGSMNEKGYGKISIGGIAMLAHRLAYEIANGPIPEGMGVLHKCNTRLCVNAEHLYAGTNRQNVDDKLRSWGCDPNIRVIRASRDVIYLNGKRSYRKSDKPRRAYAADSRHGTNRVLSADQVRKIRASSAPGIDLAAEYGVAPGTISKIRSRQLWATLPE